eukprot:scaffold251044_cov18-Tisochrysis_lutea.AAC.1
MPGSKELTDVLQDERGYIFGVLCFAGRVDCFQKVRAHRHVSKSVYDGPILDVGPTIGNENQTCQFG